MLALMLVGHFKIMWTVSGGKLTHPSSCHFPCFQVFSSSTRARTTRPLGHVYSPKHRKQTQKNTNPRAGGFRRSHRAASGSRCCTPAPWRCRVQAPLSGEPPGTAGPLPAEFWGAANSGDTTLQLGSRALRLPKRDEDPHGRAGSALTPPGSPSAGLPPPSPGCSPLPGPASPPSSPGTSPTVSSGASAAGLGSPGPPAPEVVAAAAPGPCPLRGRHPAAAPRRPRGLQRGRGARGWPPGERLGGPSPPLAAGAMRATMRAVC